MAFVPLAQTSDPPPVSSDHDLHIVRTNIDIDEQQVDRVVRRYGLPTKRVAVELALRRLDIDPMTREEALAMRGTGWSGELNELCEGDISTP